MDTDGLHNFDPYLTSVEAEIVSVGTNFVELNKTCFFGRSGGQVGDTGRIGEVAVLGTERSAHGSTYHLVAESDTAILSSGDSVTATIDVARRRQIMRLHTAQHLVELAVMDLADVGPGLQSFVSAHTAWADFVGSLAEFTELEMDALRRWVHEIVVDNLPIRRLWDGRPLWVLDGVGTIACDGTHVERTGEVGPIVIEASPIEGGRVRIAVSLAERGRGESSGADQQRQGRSSNRSVHFSETP